MRFKDLKNAQKILPMPWIPGYWALMRGWRRRRVNLSKAKEKQ